jgi:RHS repeat-associated protein
MKIASAQKGEETLWKGNGDSHDSSISWSSLHSVKIRACLDLLGENRDCPQFYAALPRGYIGQYFDQPTDLSYLNARYYDPARGQFLSEDPVFLGQPNQQNLQDPQSLNPYSYSEDNPIVKSDPSGKCGFGDCVAAYLALETAPEWAPYVVPAIGGALNVAGTYIGNYLQGRPTSPSEALVAGGAGVATGYFIGPEHAAAGAAAFGTSVAQDVAAGRPVDWGGASIAGGTAYATGAFFEYGAGVSPLEEASARAAKKGASVGSDVYANELRYQTAQGTFQTSAGAVAQYTYFNNFNSTSYSHQSTSYGGFQGVANALQSAFHPTNSVQQTALNAVLSLLKGG